MLNHVYIECEFHVFMQCESYEDLRRALLNDNENRTLYNFVKFMGSANDETVINTANYIHKVFERRQSLINV